MQKSRLKIGKRDKEIEKIETWKSNEQGKSERNILERI